MKKPASIKPKIRIKDIAEQAGVSVGTVDRVLHKRGDVNDATRKKVMAIVDQLDYTPNLLAKSLASKKIYRIAVLIPGSGDDNPYWKKPMVGLSRAEEELKDYNSHIEIFTFNATDESSFHKVAKTLLRLNPDGVVFNPFFQQASLSFVQQLDEQGIPYVYFDINLDKGNHLAYFGQDAWQSGFVSARLMDRCITESSSILVLKLANKRVISHHLNKREQGFLKFFASESDKKVDIISREIDLLDPLELEEVLLSSLQSNKNLQGVFVPSSRIFKVAQLFEKHKIKNLRLIGYDLVEDNIKYLNAGVIDFLISQKPEEQGYKGVMALFRYLVTQQETNRVNHSPIDIIVKENLNYYNLNKW